MKKIFSVETTENEESLTAYTNAEERSIFLFELFNNFRRKYKHLDNYDTVLEILDEIEILAREKGVVFDF